MFWSKCHWQNRKLQTQEERCVRGAWRWTGQDWLSQLSSTLHESLFIDPGSLYDINILVGERGEKKEEGREREREGEGRERVF